MIKTLIYIIVVSPLIFLLIYFMYDIMLFTKMNLIEYKVFAGFISAIVGIPTTEKIYNKITGGRK